MALAVLKSLVPGKQDILITSDKFSIGRATTNCCVLVFPEISRRHCLFQIRDGSWTVTDTSSNGILVNGSAVKKGEAVPISDRARFTFSENYKFVFDDMSESKSNCEPMKAIANSEIELACNSSTSVENKKLAEDTNDKTVIPQIQQSTSTVQAPSAECGSKPMEVAEPERQNPENTLLDPSTHDELQCSICLEFFIHPVTVNCSHTFCDYCLKKWRELNDMCPVCRVKIKTVTHTRVIESIINKILETANEETKQARQKLITDREQSKVKTPEATSSVLTISSDENEDDDDYDDWDVNSSYNDSMIDDFEEHDEWDDLMGFYNF